MDLDVRIRPKSGLDLGLALSFDTPAIDKAQDGYDDVLDLYRLYLEERSEAEVRYSGSLEFISPLSGKKASPTIASDLFQRVSGGNAFDFISVFKPYFCRFDGLESSPDGSKSERWIVTASATAVDMVKAGFSKNIFGSQIYNFIVHEDCLQSERRALAFSHIDYPEGQIIYGGFTDASGNTSMGTTEYSIDLGGANPVTVRFNYDNIFELPLSDSMPFTGGHIYSQSKIVMVMRPDSTDDRTLCLFEPYILKQVEALSYSRDVPFNRC